MATLETLIDHFGVDVHDYLPRELDVPVIVGLQVQGDVAVIPTRSSAKVGNLIPTEGVLVVRGEAGGNTHLLLADGTCSWAPVERVTALAPDLGVVTVSEGATAYLAHPEHGYLGIGSGDYIIRRQVEQAETIRLVQD